MDNSTRKNSEVKTRNATTGRTKSASQFHIDKVSDTFIKDYLKPRYAHLRVETKRRKKTLLPNGDVAMDADGNPIMQNVTDPLPASSIVAVSLRFLYEEVLEEGEAKELMLEFDDFVERESGASVDKVAKIQSAVFATTLKPESELSDKEKKILALIAEL